MACFNRNGKYILALYVERITFRPGRANMSVKLKTLLLPPTEFKPNAIRFIIIVSV